MIKYINQARDCHKVSGRGGREKVSGRRVAEWSRPQRAVWTAIRRSMPEGYRSRVRGSTWVGRQLHSEVGLHLGKGLGGAWASVAILEDEVTGSKGNKEQHQPGMEPKAPR